MAQGCRECGGERGVVAREIHHERGRTVIGYGQRKRPCFRRVPKRLIREFAGTSNGNAEFAGEQPNHSHPPRLVRRVREAAAEGATGVLDPFLVGSHGGGELRPGEPWLALSRRHI